MSNLLLQEMRAVAFTANSTTTRVVVTAAANTIESQAATLTAIRQHLSAALSASDPLPHVREALAEIEASK